MADMLAQNLSDKAVMGTDGVELGILENITMNLKTGTLSELLVEPHEDTPTSSIDFQTTENGCFRIPVSRVKAVKDYIVVQR